MTQLMPSRTVSASVDNDPQTVYAYVSDPRHLPAWAPGLGSAVVPPDTADGEWTVDTDFGRVGLRFLPDNEFGVADHVVRMPDGTEVLNPLRVVANGDGAEVLFTLFRRPGMTDDDFARDRAAVEADLARLAGLLAR